MNKVVVIGGDHHNTLSIIRCLGKRKIPFIVLVHDDFCKTNELMLKYSKYGDDADPDSLYKKRIQNAFVIGIIAFMLFLNQVSIINII